MKRIVAAAGAALLALSLSAADASFNLLGAYYFSDHAGYEASGFAPPDYSVLSGGAGERDLGSSWGAAEAKATFSVSERVPFFVGDGPLFSGNNVRGRFGLELSPVSANGVGQLSFTPIAFLVLDAGLGLGTGWSIGPFRGLAVNPADSNAELDLRSFGGAVWRVWGAGTFQFDLAAVVPGEWSHLVFLATAKVEYEAFTGAGADEAWLWEADLGENFNGAKFWGSYVVAYQMPARLNTVGLVAESEEWLGSIRGKSPMSSGWGSDFRIWQLGALAGFSLGERDSLALLAQFKLRPDWTDATTRLRYFGDRDYEGAYWYFNRVAFSYTRRF